ncbi:unnamed protein product [Closterium sp. NIES-65]|nr:unnamed protein product [Closterium sp. NIES-65]
MVVNKYGMRNDIQSYNLGGMGCSAGLIAIKLARDLLQVIPNTYAIVVSTENISLNLYLGNRRSMQVSNCLFRVGGAAMLLTNKSSERYRAKYELKHVVRTHLGKDDKSYGCVFQEEDDNKIVGVALSRDLMNVAGEALRTNITTLGPLVLPLSEQLLFAAVLIARKVFGMKMKPYVPDFKLAFEHFCIHAGGRAVIDEIEKNLELTQYHVEPSRMALYRFGNTSSSSIWYELSYSEAQGRVRRGDRVWQIAFGSGFKCQTLALRVARMTPDDVQTLWEFLHQNAIPVFVALNIILLAAALYFATRRTRILLVDYACFRPSEELAMTRAEGLDFARRTPTFDDKSVEFQTKVVERSARNEAEMVIFGSLDALFEKTGLKPKDISILVVNCSIFCPTPSLSAMVVNKYGMRNDIQSYNLGGMGCSAGLIAIKLAQDLLQVTPNTYAVVVSTENISQNIYLGTRRSMQVSNCLFRLGGAAMLLTNKSSERRRAKYELKHVVRTHMGRDDKSYGCVFQEEDDNGVVGVALSKDLMNVAGESLRTNITTLGPLVLPLSEQLLFAAVLIARKVFGVKMKPYVPDFKLAFEHFCIHAGGRAVIDELEKNLDLTNYQTEPSRMALYRFGNTSSSSIWYELSYAEAQGRVRRGDRVWQIAFGSGFKCQSAVWQALRRIDPKKNRGVWAEYYDEVGGPEMFAAALADAQAPVRPIPAS